MPGMLGGGQGKKDEGVVPLKGLMGEGGLSGREKEKSTFMASLHFTGNPG